MVERVKATAETYELLNKLKAKHGPVMFHQSGGCCDGSSPMCYEEGDLLIGSQDVLLGSIDDTPFYMNKKQFDYWKHTQLIIDVVDGRGGMFSLEGVEGKRFLTRSRAFTKEELEELKESESV
ncbi:DUF779 domain-containing protein [Halobacillus sp. ACCC02827]|uniref:DUF779 domain-containing protein n=1 Tax=Bacillaceae TaxID=186817 RepID=UPI0002A502E9|nr:MULTISPECIES: DUF779 domain-containing protein [Bacillaceae]ELK46374.1 hypothetical protein D479_11141 [Halobacillus sp. BAB-2008]QHT48322.1 DUF779 domain-containing protein [Bacillus sp. SB49]WJE15560.1 DUF779 domain-containing protein [Halobacillus sp. ACCC02827]